MPYVTLRDQGYYEPGRVLSDVVKNQLSAKQARQNIDEQDRQFKIEQAVREAESQPKINPEVVRNNVLARVGTSRGAASDASFSANLPFYQRQALAHGQLPTQTETSSSYGPNGETITNTKNSLPTGETDEDGGMVRAPFSGSTNTSLPALSTATRILPSDPNGGPPGLATVATDKYQLKDPSQPDTPENRKVVSSNQTVQRTTPPRGDTALLELMDDPEISDDKKEAIRGLLNKRSATAPADPGAAKETSQWRQNELEIRKKTAQLRLAVPGSMQASDLKSELDRLQNMNKFLSTPKKDARAEALQALLGDDAPPAVQPPAAGGSEMPPAAAANINNAAKSAGGNTPTSTKPAGEKQQFVSGKVYKDANGNRARWDGTKFVPVAGQQ